jgi:hypothetical protein
VVAVTSRWVASLAPITSIWAAVDQTAVPSAARGGADVLPAVAGRPRCGSDTTAAGGEFCSARRSRPRRGALQQPPATTTVST